MITKAYKEIYVIPDIHGDFIGFFVSLVILSEIIILNPKTKKYIWNPNKRNIALIIMGDIIDRERGLNHISGEFENEEEYIVSIINCLMKIAPNFDSRVFKLMGNHEYMRVVLNDYRNASKLARKNKIYLYN